MKCVDGELVEWSRHGRTEFGRKSCVALLSPPHIPDGLAWDWTRACAVRGRRLNAVIICDPRSFCVGMILSRYVSISGNSGVFGGARYKFCLFYSRKHDSEAVIRPTYCRPAFVKGVGGWGGRFTVWMLLCMYIDFPSEINLHIDTILYQFLRLSVYVCTCT